jgi:hypothetical protein
MDGIRPEVGALFDPNKSIRAGENKFALDSALLRISPASFVGSVDARNFVTSDLGDEGAEFESPPSRQPVRDFCSTTRSHLIPGFDAKLLFLNNTNAHWKKSILVDRWFNRRRGAP